MHVDRDEWGTFVKIRRRLVNQLERELKGRSGVIGLGTMTDPYQPVEDRTRITRRCLEAISRSDMKVSVHTKSDLVLRDIDILQGMVDAEVGITVTSIDASISTSIEPGAPPPQRRIDALSKLIEEGVDSYALIGPILPLVIDRDKEAFVEAISSTGIKRVMFDPLRLRTGMMDHMVKRLKDLEGFDLSKFSKLSDSREYFLLIQQELDEMFRRKGVRCIDVF